MKEKVIQDSKEKLGWRSYILIGVSILIGSVLASLENHQGLNWFSIGIAASIAVILPFIYFSLHQVIRNVKQ